MDREANRLILSDMELNLCMLLLGREDWDGFPVKDTGESLEKKMAEAFSSLMSRGWLFPEEDSVALTGEYVELFRVMAFPDSIRLCRTKNEVQNVIYEKGQKSVLWEPIRVQPDHCRVSLWETEELAASLEEQYDLPEGSFSAGTACTSEELEKAEFWKNVRLVVVDMNGDGKPESQRAFA